MIDRAAIRDAREASDCVQSIKSRALELLRYDATTGHLVWIKPPRRGISVGRIAGKKGPTGDIVTGFDGRTFRAHRLIWLMVYGRWPLGDIDHVNGIPSDNRIDNLRECTRSNNCANTKRPKTNLSGFKGASLHRKSGKFAARIRVRGKRIWLGLYDKPELAHAAYVKAAKQYFGEFARSR